MNIDSFQYRLFEGGGFMNTEQILHDLYVRIGKNITYLRNNSNITQDDLASALRINSQSLISQYEHAKKAPSIERIADFCEYFNISLEDMLFKDFSSLETKENMLAESHISAPIQKCAGRTYYGYYIKESEHYNDGIAQVISKISRFEIEIQQTNLSHQASVILLLPDSGNQDKIDGVLHMDESYAYIACYDKNIDFFFGLTFFYHRQRKSKRYIGGMALLQTLDCHILPISQLCIISSNAISFKHYSELQKLLEIDINNTTNKNLSRRTLSSKAILRLTKEKDNAVLIG